MVQTFIIESSIDILFTMAHFSSSGIDCQKNNDLALGQPKVSNCLYLLVLGLALTQFFELACSLSDIIKMEFNIGFFSHQIF